MNTSGPTTKEELSHSLDEAILQAHENGVEIESGAYPLYHDDPDIPDVEIMFFLLQS